MKYDYQLHLEVENNSHTQIIRRIPPGASVLELGCATGYMSAHLKQALGCRVVGVELDREAARRAEAHCDRVIRADVEDPAWLEQLAGERFDIVTCADILEHLRDPESLLERLRECIEPEGRLLASIPNSAHASIRLELLAGHLTYEDTGLLDRTHLHLYTHESVRALFTKAGFQVDELSYTFHDLADEVIRGWLERVGLEATERALAVLHAPDAAAFQFIIRAHALKAGEHPVAFRELTDKPLQDSEEVYSKRLQALHEALHEAREAAQVRGVMIEERNSELAAQHQAILEKDATLATQHQAILERDATRAEQHQAIVGYAEAVAGLRAQIDGLKQAQAEKLQQIQGESQRLKVELNRLYRKNGSLQQALTQHTERLQAMVDSHGWRTWMSLTYPVRVWRQIQPLLAYLMQQPRQGARLLRTLSKSWRAGGKTALKQRLAEQFEAPPAPPPPPRTIEPDYAAWIARHERLDPAAREAMWAFIDTQEKPPLISIIMPVYNVQACWLRQALDSLSSQSWPWWEACVADDASTDPGVVRVLREYMQRDRRIKVAFRAHNGHIAAASNTALEMARGDFVALMDHDDLLPETALYFVAREILEHPEADLIYSDEDKIDEEGYRFAHYFKPDYNPDLMLSHNMVCHFGVYRRRLVSEIGGFREGYEGAQDYDLALRAIARIGLERIRHIPRILYHWRLLPESTASGVAAKPYAMDAAIRAVSENLKQRGIEAQVTESPLIQGMLRVKYALPEHPPLVSIIIPTRNGLTLLQRCIESLLEKTRYPHFEIIVVDNDSDDPATLAYLDRQAEAGRIRVVAYPEPFNFSAINNAAVTHCQGELLAFLNNDLEVISEDWLGEMVSHAVRPEIGAVGARLWYPDDRLQHAGVVLGLGGVAGHAMKYLPRVEKGYNARAVLVQDYSAVTAACLVVRREIFDQAGGFDEAHLGVAFNDVDLCLRILELGYRNLWTPFAEFYHHESASRGLEDTPEKQARFGAEIDYMKHRWGPALQRDPAYNPNLTHAREDFSLQN